MVIGFIKNVKHKVGAMPVGGGDPSKYRIGAYARVDDRTPDSLKNHILIYGTVKVGFTGSSEGWQGETIRPPKTGETTWGHACFVPGTKVLTKTGYKNIEDIKEGEIVLTHLGNWKKVKATMNRRFEGLINRIRAHNQVNPLYATDEHPIYTDKMTSCSKFRQKGKERLKHFDWSPASEIKKYNAILSPIPFGKENINIDNDLAYVLGLYVADGNLIRGTLNPIKFKGIRFSLNRDVDQEVQDKLINIFKKKFSLLPRFYHSKRGRDVQIIFYNAELARYFASMAGTPNNKDINNDLINSASPEVLDNFIQGWLDGDGCDYGMSYTGFTSSETLAYQIQTILQRCRKSYGVSRRTDRTTSFGKSSGWTFNIRKEYPQKSKTHYWDNNEIKRVTNTYKESYNGYVYNLEVEDDNSYIAEGVSVHNCALVGYEKNYLTCRIREKLPHRTE